MPTIMELNYQKFFDGFLHSCAEESTHGDLGVIGEIKVVLLVESVLLSEMSLDN